MEIRIAGLGGQGVVLAGHIFGKAAACDGLYVVQTQSYGAEARGSAARSEVIISDQKIGYPMVRKCDVLVAMSQTALDKHFAELKENGALMIDDDTVKNIPHFTGRIYRVPATNTAESRLKSKMYANTIMLGALTKIASWVKKETVKKAITDTVPESVRINNIEGFKIGYELIPTK